MSEYYSDYLWRNGIPYGITKIAKPSSRCFKIPSDPYRKRIVIEENREEAFERVIYDSALLDFRHLKPPAEQTAWHKITLKNSATEALSQIRNQDDRLICLETCLFQNQFCTECRLFSPHGFALSVHKLFYKALNHTFNGVILYDTNEHPVMLKRYEVDDEKGDFTTLLEENWDIKTQAIPAS